MPKLHVVSMPHLEYFTDDFVLRRKSRELEKSDLNEQWFKHLINDMFETLYADSSGIGLAAPQIGMSIRLVVIDIRRDTKKPIVLVNPTYSVLESEKASSNETCLSVPFHSGEVMRFKKVLVNALDVNGNPIEIIGEKFLSNVLQHEIDHLDGILYIDRMDDIYKIESNLGYAATMAKKAMLSLEEGEKNK